MIEYRVLIYENNGRTLQKLCGLARQVGMSPVACVNAAEAKTALAAHFMELALVNLGLEPVELPANTRCIALSSTDPRTQDNLFFYCPEAIITTSAKDAAILFNLIKVSGIIPATQSLACHLVELTGTIEEELFRLQTLLATRSANFSFLQSVEEYCHYTCSFSRTSDELSAQEIKEYTPIFMGSGRGHLMCKFRPKCMLHLLAAHLQHTYPEISEISPAEVFLKVRDNDETKTTLAFALKKVHAKYALWSEKLLKAREELCKKTCLTLDPQGGHGDMIKHKCCEFGCVLDNYFDMNPDKKYLKPSKTLIYENNASDVKILDFICREFKMEPSFAENPGEAQELLRTTTFDYAIINPELESITLPSRTKIIIVDEPSVALIARILTYRPVSVISKPFTVPTLSAGITKALGIPFPQISQFTTINNLCMSLERFETALGNWQIHPNNRLNFENSTRYFCENRCPMATTKSAIKDNELGQYHLLNPFAKRGALYCKLRPTCRLWTFLDHLKKQGPAELLLAPTDVLNIPRPRTQIESTANFTAASSEHYIAHAEMLNSQRSYFCTEICEKHKKDMDVGREDFLFSSFREVLAQNYYLYCSEHTCPLMAFFEYFKRHAG